MNGWNILLRLLVCGTGALVFLHFVADRLSGTKDALRSLEKREEKAWQKRQSEASRLVEVDADGVVS